MIGNFQHALAHGDQHKKKRLSKKEGKENDNVTAVIPDMSPTDVEERNAFRQRRDKINKAKSTKECFDIAPIYRTIEGVIIML